MDPSQGGVLQPEEILTQRDLIQAALRAMQQLSESDQEALLATFWDEAATVEA